MAVSRAQRRIDERAERVVRRVRARVLRGIVEDDATLQTVYAEVARRLREELGVTAPEGAIEAIVQRELARASERVVPLIERRILSSAHEGRETAARVLRLVTDVQTGESGPSPFAPSSGAPPRLSLHRSDESREPSRETD